MRLSSAGGATGHAVDDARRRRAHSRVASGAAGRKCGAVHEQPRDQARTTTATWSCGRCPPVRRGSFSAGAITASTCAAATCLYVHDGALFAMPFDVGRLRADRTRRPRARRPGFKRDHRRRAVFRFRHRHAGLSCPGRASVEARRSISSIVRGAPHVFVARWRTGTRRPFRPTAVGWRSAFAKGLRNRRYLGPRGRARAAVACDLRPGRRREADMDARRPPPHLRV